MFTCLYCKQFANWILSPAVYNQYHCKICNVLYNVYCKDESSITIKYNASKHYKPYLQCHLLYDKNKSIEFCCIRVVTLNKSILIKESKESILPKLEDTNDILNKFLLLI